MGTTKNFFETYLKKETLFLDKSVLQSSYTPDTIPHREEQTKQVAEILAPALKMELPSNLFIYGKTGTGKTLVIKHITSQLIEITRPQQVVLQALYTNCKLKRVADTEYRFIAELCRTMGKTVPPTGLPTDEVYKIFLRTIDDTKQIIILILDEIDHLINKAGDEVLYNLLRLNAELSKCRISIIGISNDVQFIDYIDPRIRSSLSEEEIVFPPYNALQIQHILRDRAEKAFKKGSLNDGVVEKCAAYAAREHGDARRALDLLRVAGELAEREGLPNVSVKHIDLAEDKIERDRLVDIVTTQPQQFQAVLYSSINVCAERGDVSTGEVYDFYKKLCSHIGIRPLTQRRVSDVIAELDMLGIINARVISKGRYGRTKETNQEKILVVLKEGLGLK